MNSNKCRACIFSREIPGDTHVSCTQYNPLLEVNEHGRKNGWANYPINYDPIWLKGECKQFKEERPEKESKGIRGIGFSSSIEEFRAFAKKAVKYGYPDNVVKAYVYNSIYLGNMSQEDIETVVLKVEKANGNLEEI